MKLEKAWQLGAFSKQIWKQMIKKRCGCGRKKNSEMFQQPCCVMCHPAHMSCAPLREDEKEKDAMKTHTLKDCAS